MQLAPQAAVASVASGTLRSAVRNFFTIKKETAAPFSAAVSFGCFGTIRTTYRRKSFGFPLTSCGARKNLRASLFLDFFDRCANPCSLPPPQAAVASVASGTLRSAVRNFFTIKKETAAPFSAAVSFGNSL